ncbi:MAG: hypothetical protein FJ196_03895 [Gammaproteobacteria bacterium]|nr:hypothetical protein [Gammaproteobacteria bacterium]
MINELRWRPHMKTLLSLALVAGSIAAGPAFAACTYPKAPDSIPDGNTATLDQMLTAQRAVKAFDSAITAYQGCLENENNAAFTANPDLTDEQKKERLNILAQKHNAAVDEAQGLADRLNAQIRVYKEKNAKK